jgi:hypothetical protein
MDPDKPMKVTIPGSFSLDEIQGALQYHELYAYTFRFIDADDTAKANTAYFEAKLPPEQPVVIQPSAALPTGATKVWDGNVYAAGRATVTAVNVYRAKASA